MSKLSFRARALDAAKPLPVYRDRDLPERKDCVSISRAVPQMPTGMEKEEELEHHLQRAVSAQQVFREKKESMVIPVPGVQGNIGYYDHLYKGEFGIPKQLIHIQSFSLDSEQPDYDMDSEDEILLSRLKRKMEIKPIQFETMVDRLEKASGNQLVTLQEAKLLLNEDDCLLKWVYDYWVRKRKNCRGPCLISQVKQEKRDGSTNNDPYVAFRRRTEKMQTRKNRKNDEASYEKMLRLRRQFSRTVTILEMIKRREKTKRELLHLTLEVVERRYQMGDFGGEILNKVNLPWIEKSIYSSPVCPPNRKHCITENKNKHPYPVIAKTGVSFDFARPKKKYVKKVRLDDPQQCLRGERQATTGMPDVEQYDFHSSEEEGYSQSPLSESDENDPDGMFAFRRKAGCHYLAPQREQSELAGLLELLHGHRLTALSTPRRCLGLACRRVGRGGRVLMDRLLLELYQVLKKLHPDQFTAPPSSTPPLDSEEASVWSIASRTFPNSSSSLAEVLRNTKACRWHCFRPRARQDGHIREEGVWNALGWTANTSCGAVAVPPNPSGGITEERFQTSQQQEIQMKQKQPIQHSTQPKQCDTQVPEWADHVSKTPDSAKARFATSPTMGSRHTRGGTTRFVSETPHLQSTSTALSINCPPATSVQLISVVPGRALARSPDGAYLSLPGLGVSQLSTIRAVSPVDRSLCARCPSFSPPALKLATVAATLDCVPKPTLAR